MDETTKLKRQTSGREVMRIQGVYQYVINRNGLVGAIMGFQPFVVVVYEDSSDREPLRGYLRVGRWIYPLARSFSPIYAWGPDRLVMPEPFSPLTEPVYIVVRLPIALSRYQKDTLWNLLDVNAHLRGKFTHPSVDELKRKDKLFQLTEITPYERYQLDRAQEGKCPPGTQNLPSLDHPNMVHKLKALGKNEARLSVCFGNPKQRQALSTECVKELQRTKADKKRCGLSPLPDSLHPINRGISNVLTSDGLQQWRNIAPGGAPNMVTLPQTRGNLIRLYVLGPRDLQHISCSTVLQWVLVPQIILSAVNQAFKQQLRLRREKEQHGVPPIFDDRIMRWLTHWGAAENVNAFGVAKRNEPWGFGPNLDPEKLDPVHSLMFHNAMALQNLEKAAEIFDYAIEECKVELLSYAPGVSDMDRSTPTRWLSPLIPRDLLVRYRKTESTFHTLMTLSASLEGEVVYKTLTNYSERLHEECEHHYPEVRPRNPPTDPKYPYPRRPSPVAIEM